MDFLEIGKIVKPQGLKGRIKVLSYLESDDLLKTLTVVAIRRGVDSVLRLPVTSLQVKDRCFYMELAGIEHIDQAKALVGSAVLVPSDSLAELSEGEYYWQELLGIDVMTEEGVCVGRLETIFPTVAHDVYVCRGEEEEIFLPALAEVIRNIDIKGRTMTVRLPATAS